MMNWCSRHQLFEICPECMRELREAEEVRKWCLYMAEREKAMGDADCTTMQPEAPRFAPPQPDKP